MQCHLETTSRPLPNSLVRFNRGVFTYQPSEPLSDFVLHFDHAKDAGHDDKFEIVSSVYRLCQSRCFVASSGELGCTTCHNPHDIPRGETARAAFDKACQSCHAQLNSAHPPGPGCAGCHMPRGRIDDIVHTVMTHHKIVRRPPPGDLLAARAERNEPAGKAYQVGVEFYYPPSARDQELDLAIAQVAQKSNLRVGIPRLRALSGKEPRVSFALGQANEAQDTFALD